MTVFAPDRTASMRAAIAEEPEPLVTLTHLLHLCRDQHRVLWERVSDPDAVNKVAQLRNRLTGVLPAPSTATTLEPPVRRALVAALGHIDVPSVVIARALAEVIDEHYSHTFVESFRRRSPYQPGVGDPVPLNSPDLRDVIAMRSTSPPWRLANRLDETRHIRLAGEWAVQFRLVFDYGHFDALADLITPGTVMATCHPNRGLEDFDLRRGADRRTFPVHPVDPDHQRAEIDQLISSATTAGASIVVLPELSVTEPLALGLEEWVRRPDGPRLLVAGSYHRDGRADKSSPAARRNTAIAWVRGHEQPLRHDKYSPADEPVLEGIDPDGWPEVRVYVTADGWHLVILICRDLLNPQAVNALTEAGVNLVLVPAMSETLMTFGGPVAHLVGAHQALVAVANNPATWTHNREAISRQPARALFGHPGLGQQIRFVRPREPEPGVALMTVHSAAITWLSATSDHDHTASGTHPQRTEQVAETPWLKALASRTQPPSPRAQPATVALRRAAVLALLSDGPTGPSVLLTERAADLSDYPGQLVFPGGAVDPDDTGPAATALREAHEEVGLDPGAVEIIGLLPPLALPDSGFLVDPVLAWSPHSSLNCSVNFAEVADTYQVPLHELAHLPMLGRMTASVIDLLLGILSHNDTESPPAADRDQS